MNFPNNLLALLTRAEIERNIQVWRTYRTRVMSGNTTEIRPTPTFRIITKSVTCRRFLRVLLPDVGTQTLLSFTWQNMTSTASGPTDILLEPSSPACLLVTIMEPL
jgi:hypothetical protein